MVEGIHTAMILAAGMGTRLRPLTDEMPKPLINVGGKPIVFRILDAVRAAGIKRVVINTHYLGSMLEKAVREHDFGMQVHFSREEELLETGGGMKKALPLLGDHPFLVVNSDAVWLDESVSLLRPLMAGFDVVQHDVLMAVVPTSATEGFRTEAGDFKLDVTTHKLKRPKDRAKADVVYMGVHVTHPAFVAKGPEGKFSLVKPWQEAEAAGRLHGHLYKGLWVDMGSPVGLEHARMLVK